MAELAEAVECGAALILGQDPSEWTVLAKLTRSRGPRRERGQDVFNGPIEEERPLVEPYLGRPTWRGFSHALKIRPGCVQDAQWVLDKSSCHGVRKPEASQLVTRQPRASRAKRLDVASRHATVPPHHDVGKASRIAEIHDVLPRGPQQASDLACGEQVGALCVGQGMGELGPHRRNEDNHHRKKHNSSQVRLRFLWKPSAWRLPFSACRSASINHLRKALRRVFSSAAKKGVYRGLNPIDGVERRKVPRRMLRTLTPEEVPLLLAQRSPCWRPGREGFTPHHPISNRPKAKGRSPSDFSSEDRPLDQRAIQDSNLWPLAPEANALSS